ncbi:cobalamin biosynthesis protein [Angomonas deanei]|nr:cobalamin biosynthesis protein [Angomonas deanei]|eukprot:EPY24969.1 cobalamin biosynthesis protein [Angomonas deanei]
MLQVCLIFGFLGAGKTTILQKVVPTLPDEKILLVVNDFSDNNVDAFGFTDSETRRVKGLSGGCVCCNLLGDLVQLLTNAHADGFTYAFVECTGVSDTAPVVATLGALPALNNIVEVDCVLSVVSAAFADHLRQQSDAGDSVSSLKRTQLLGSNVILINNWESFPNVSPSLCAEWSGTIKRLTTLSNPSLRVFFTNEAYFAFKELIFRRHLFSQDGSLAFFLKAFGDDGGTLGEFSGRESLAGEVEKLGLVCHTYHWRRPLNIERLTTSLNTALGKCMLRSVWRSKGFFMGVEDHHIKQFRWQSAGRNFDFGEVAQPYVSMLSGELTYDFIVVFIGDFDASVKEKELSDFLLCVQNDDMT